MIDIHALIVVVIVALGTYLFKLSGLLLSSRVPKEGKLRIVLDSLPATLLIALITPAIFREGIMGIVAALLIVWSMTRVKNPLVAMVLGIAFIALGRQFTI